MAGLSHPHICTRLRCREPGRHRLPGDGVSRRGDPGPAARRRERCRWTRRSRSLLPLSQMPWTRRTGKGFSAETTQSAPLTERGSILGTLHYMAPEQLEGKEADARVDLFSFGAVVYEMVTGTRAFAGDSTASVIAAILNARPPAMVDLRPIAPVELEDAVGVCLARDPDDRWQTARDLLRDLRRIARDTASQGPQIVAVLNWFSELKARVPTR